AGDLVAQPGGRRGGSAVVDDDGRRPGQVAFTNEFANAFRDDFRQCATFGESGSEAEMEGSDGGLQVDEVRVQRRANRALRADEEREEEKVAFALRPGGRKPRRECPRPGSAQIGDRNALAVLP